MARYYNTRRHQQYTLNTVPVQIAPPLTGTVRISVTIFNAGATLVSLSNSATDTVNVQTLPPGAAVVDRDSNDAWYASAPSGAGTVQITEVSGS